MPNSIDVLTFHKGYSDTYSITRAISEYDEVHFLNNQQTYNFIENYYSNGYLNYSFLDRNTGLMPPGVKYITPNAVVFERPPSYQNIFYIADTVHSEMSERVHTFRVALPWQLYIAFYNSEYYTSNVFMYFMDGPLTFLDQPIYAPFIPNFYPNGMLCRPNFSSMDDIERYTKDISGVIASAFDWVWNNGTNHDLTEAMTLLPKYSSDINSTVVASYVQENGYFGNVHHKLSYSQVISSFQSWEKIDIKDIINYKWVSPSKTFHDQPNNLEDVVNTNVYIENLPEWLSNYYSEDDEESLEYRLDNDEYDNSEYLSFLLGNGLISGSSTRQPVTYREKFTQLLQEMPAPSKPFVTIERDIAKVKELSAIVS